MRNLTNIGHSVDFPISGPLSLTAVTWDTSNDALICAFGPSEEDAGIELKRVPQGAKDGDYPVIAAWDASCPNPSLLHDRILCLHYFPDSSTTCLVLAGGDIVAVREEPLPNEEQVEIVGSVDAGIAAASWSPDEELIAIVTSADTLLFMTRHFESTINVVFSLDDVKVSNHVSVGWGKAETQFKGKRAKALRDPTVPEHVDEGSLSEFDDGSVYISWRGDGAYLVINTVEDKNRRMIRVYSRQGILDSVSEPVDYLEGPISWRPAGNLIAGVQRLKEKLRIVFFERNGLRHGEFDLSLAGPFDPQDQTSWITALHWNANSSVLAICFPDRIQLWTMSNYHYYLKQEVSFANRSDRDLTLSWHPERPLRLTAFNARE